MKINKKNTRHLICLIIFSINVLISIVIRKINKSKNKSPLIILYGHKLNSNLLALFTYLKKRQTDIQYCFLTMDKEYHNKLISEKFNSYYACDLTCIKLLSKANLIVSDHGLHCMSLLLKYTDVKFVDVWHGLPFKGFDEDDFRIQHQYHAVCVTSKHLQNLYIDRFGFDEKKVVITGYGRTDLLLEDAMERDFISHALPNDISRLVLFAPTWKQDSDLRSIYPFDMNEDEFLCKIDQICIDNDAYLIMRTHLNSQNKVTNKYRRILFRPHSKYPDTESLLRIIDVLICDWSSISLDYLILERPTIYLDVEAPFKKGLSLDKDNRVGLIAKDINDLERGLVVGLNNSADFLNTYMNDREDKISLLYDDTVDGKSAQRYYKVIQSLL